MHAGKHLGLTIGIVSNRKDPDDLGRVKVRFPTHGNRESDWARVMTPFAGTTGGPHGSFTIPEEGDEVIVGHDSGDPKIPIILGSVYSQKQKPPTTKRDERMLKTPKGHFIVISDEAGAEKIEIKTASGQHVTLDEASKTVTVEATQTVEVKAAQRVNVTAQSVVLDASSVVLGGAQGTELAVLGTSFMTAFCTHTHAETGATTLTPTGLSDPTIFLSKKTTLAG